MDTSFLDNQDELAIEKFNGSFRKALKKKNGGDAQEEIKDEMPVEKTRANPRPDLKTAAGPDSVRISISKETDKKVRERILRHYMETGEKISIKLFVERCIDCYLK